ncbi:choline O-acetyltransferase-like [Choristoneura fumiferana]|uniref:choline O-acetyltransferase-like n=1 Tax=Choristoneura fumiferana TaxID=7141 RepID=UPI003D15A0C7
MSAIFSTANSVYEKAWGESLLSLPKRWLSQQGDDDEFENVQLPKLPVPDLQATLETYLELAGALGNDKNRDLIKFLKDIIKSREMLKT